MARIWPGEVCVRSTSSWPSAVARAVAVGRAGDVEGVPQVARRVVGRDVEQLEVQLVGLDLGRLEVDEAELAQDARDLALRLDQRVQRAARQRPAGQRDVGSLARQANLDGDLVEAPAARGDGRLELLADWVGHGADLWPVLAGQSADAAEQLAQLTVAAQVRRLDAHRARRGRQRARPREGATAQVVELLGEGRQVHGGWCRYLARATSAMLAKVAASRTAMSARTLRSRTTPAFLSPLMSAL